MLGQIFSSRLPLLNFHLFFSLRSAEPHHSLPLSVFPFRPCTLSIIPFSTPSSCRRSAPYFCPPSSPCSLSSVTVTRIPRNRIGLPPFVRFFLVYLSVFPKPQRVMKILLYGGVIGSHIPPSQQPINQQPRHSTGNQAILECPVLILPQSFTCGSTPPVGQW